MIFRSLILFRIFLKNTRGFCLPGGCFSLGRCLCSFAGHFSGQLLGFRGRFLCLGFHIFIDTFRICQNVFCFLAGFFFGLSLGFRFCFLAGFFFGSTLGFRFCFLASFFFGFSMNFFTFRTPRSTLLPRRMYP